MQPTLFRERCAELQVSFVLGLTILGTIICCAAVVIYTRRSVAGAIAAHEQLWESCLLMRESILKYLVEADVSKDSIL